MKMDFIVKLAFAIMAIGFASSQLPVDITTAPTTIESIMLPTITPAPTTGDSVSTTIIPQPQVLSFISEHYSQLASVVNDAISDLKIADPVIHSQVTKILGGETTMPTTYDNINAALIIDLAPNLLDNPSIVKTQAQPQPTGSIEELPSDLNTSFGSPRRPTATVTATDTGTLSSTRASASALSSSPGAISSTAFEVLPVKASFTLGFGIVVAIFAAIF